MLTCHLFSVLPVNCIGVALFFYVLSTNNYTIVLYKSRFPPHYTLKILQKQKLSIVTEVITIQSHPARPAPQAHPFRCVPPRTPTAVPPELLGVDHSVFCIHLLPASRRTVVLSVPCGLYSHFELHMSTCNSKLTI